MDPVVKACTATIARVTASYNLCGVAVAATKCNIEIRGSAESACFSGGKNNVYTALQRTEMRKILELATRDRGVSAPASSASGLTLTEIQSIGAEVGIDSAVVARAAAALDDHPDIQTRAVLGVPFATGMTVALPRALTEEEWDQLVAELRSTFGARGHVRTEGNYKEWRNGNLHAVVERAPAGFRLRIATRKGNAAAFAGVGAIGIVTAAITWMTNFVFIDGSALLPPLLFGVGGVTALAANAARLPRWAKRRQQQMQHVASVIRQILAQPGSAE